MSRQSSIHTHHATVTAIVPVYNGAAHVGACLGSIFAQTVLPNELIVVDDGSTDDSLDAVKSATSDDHGVVVKIVSQANQGQSAARNEAARLASGALLAFCDQDDLWLPRHVEQLRRPLAAHRDLGWAYSDFDEIDLVGRTVTKGFIDAHGLDQTRRTLGQFLQSDLMMLPSASMIRASAFWQVGGFDHRLCGYEDDDLFIRLFRAGWGSRFVRESLTRYRVHPQSASASARFLQSRLLFFDKLVQDVPSDERLNRFFIRDLVLPRLLHTTVVDYATALRTGHYDQARLIARAIADLHSRSPVTARRRAKLAMLQRPEAMHTLLRVHHSLPRRLRPRLGEALCSAVRQR